MFKIGHGYDVHQLIAHETLILGGVKIDYHLGLKGHSDADVVLHAVCDAILGALALGDIGQHFPDSDSNFKGVDSRRLLRDVVNKMQAQNMLIGNLDITIVAQEPKLSLHLHKMKENIAQDCNTTKERVNVKATTTEHLGFVGRIEGISCHCVTLLCEGDK